MDLITKQPSLIFKSIIGVKNYPLTKEEEYILRSHFLRGAVNLRARYEDEKGIWKFAPADILRSVHKVNHREYNNCLEAIRDYYPQNPFIHIKSYTQLHAFYKSCRETESINELADYYGFASLLDENKKSRNKAKAFKECEYLDIRLPTMMFFPQELITSIGTFKREDEAIPLTAPQGRFIGGLICYKNPDERTVYFPGHIASVPGKFGGEHPILIPGTYSRPNYLLYEHLLEQRPDTTVLLCASHQVSVRLNDITQEPCEQNVLRYITATAPVDGILDLVNADIGGLKGKYVVYIPDVTRESYFAANEIEKLCREAGAVSFKILREPVLCHPPAGGQVEIDALDDPWERYLITRAITLADPDSPSLRTIADQAVNLPEFVKWGVETNLIRAELDVPVSSHPLKIYTEPTPEEIDKLSKSEIHLDFLTTYQEIGAIIAEPHAGKTLFAINYCVAMCSGLPFLHFSASPIRRICYFDAETPEVKFKMLQAQSINAFNANSEIVKENFKFRAIRDEIHGEVVDISKDKFQKDFEVSIKEHKADIAVFDNLISLIPEFRNTGRYNWPDIWNWMMSLEREYKVSILILHHDNGKGDGAGTSDIRAQCGTILFLQDPRSKFVKGDWTKGTNSPFADYISKEGVLFKATIEKCRKYPTAVYSEFGAYFAYDAEQPIAGRPWEIIDVRSGQTGSVDSAFASNEEEIESLYPGRTKREYIALSLCLKNGRMMRKDLEQALNMSGGTCANVITKLRQDGLLDKRESGPATYYTLRRGQNISQLSTI